MMVVDLQIALAANFEIEETVTREELQHVIEKRNACRDAHGARAVQIKRNANLGLFCLPFDFCLTIHLNISLNSTINLSFSSGVPTLIRTYSESIGALLMSRIRIPFACKASNNSFGCIAVLTQKKFAAEGLGDNPLIFCNSTKSRSRSRCISSINGRKSARFSSAVSATSIEKKFKL